MAMYLRVNGIEINNIRVRRKMVVGFMTSDWELVIEDPILGRFAIDDSFIIEAKNDLRKKWKLTSVKNFLAMLDSIEALS